MINHVRTLLLNKSATELGTIAIDPVADDFVTITLPAPLAALRSALFPTGMSIVQQQQRATDLMRLLHAPDLEDYALRFDPRYTYGLAARRTMLANIEISEWRSSDCDVKLHYNLYADNPAPDLCKNGVPLIWSIGKSATTSNYVELSLNGKELQPVQLAMIDGHTQTLDLLPDYLTVRYLSDANSFDGKFRSELTLTPYVYFSLESLLAALDKAMVGHGAGNAMFTQWYPYADDITALRDGWHHSDESHIKAGCAMLAYAYQCERIRRGNK